MVGKMVEASASWFATEVTFDANTPEKNSEDR